MLYGNILTPEGWRLGWLRWQAGRVTAIDGEAVDPNDNAHPRLLPGFVDLHVHGGGGADAMEGARPRRPWHAPMCASALPACWSRP
ncbi:hypothetical protein QO259_11560 [Salinicola sp. JS01]|uniref:hypothetical protein n=1 Tax=Salinicola sp. JS01 TaxID=3050071 RepID=UPI00255C0FB1|nr:hypothetical protein [Salinicola sp. JS01]WIX31458.1 hypothetical protein QO259_11560 [Salinicola sp. JS01]